MKCLIRCFSFVFVVFATVLVCGYVYAYGDLTHRSITSSAVDTTDMMRVFPEHIRCDMEIKILDACVLPDYEEVGFLYRPHFYDPTTWFDGLKQETAFKCMYEHFCKGIEDWKSENRLSAVRELGASMHYMEDMCCVVHLTGWSNPQHMIVHKNYEKCMDEKSSEFSFYILKLNLLNRFNFRETIDIRGTARAYSMHALNSYLENGNRFPKVRFQEFETAHNACCELIYLFFKEVGIDL